MSVKYICDSCGADCLDVAYFITIQEMVHPMRFPIQGSTAKVLEKTPQGHMTLDGKKQFMLCQDCYRKTRLPNPFGESCSVKAIEEEAE